MLKIALLKYYKNDKIAMLEIPTKGGCSPKPIKEGFKVYEKDN